MSEEMKPPTFEKKKATTRSDLVVSAGEPGTPVFRPRTPLGKELWAIRQRVVASGAPLLGWDELERELKKRRGEAK